MCVDLGPAFQPSPVRPLLPVSLCHSLLFPQIFVSLRLSSYFPLLAPFAGLTLGQILHCLSCSWLNCLRYQDIYSSGCSQSIMSFQGAKRSIGIQRGYILDLNFACSWRISNGSEFLSLSAIFLCHGWCDWGFHPTLSCFLCCCLCYM